MTQLAIDEPVRWDLRINRGTDHEWTCRRVDGNLDPIIPDEIAAQVRRSPRGELWCDLVPTLDEETGWITLSLDEAGTAADVWDLRRNGVWDLEVVVSGRRLRWAEGTVTVSQDVTRDE